MSKLDKDTEAKVDEWFYKYASPEPDDTHTLVMHELHDNGCCDALLALISQEVTRGKIEELEAIAQDYYQRETVPREKIYNRIAELKGEE